MNLKQNVFDIFAQTGKIDYYILLKELEEHDVQEHTGDSDPHR